MYINFSKNLPLGINIILSACSLHDINQALAFGDRFFLMKDGVIRYQGDSDCITEAVMKDVFDVEVEMMKYKGKTFILGGNV